MLSIPPTFWAASLAVQVSNGFFMFPSPYAHQEPIGIRTQSSLCSQRTDDCVAVVPSSLWSGSLQLSLGNGGGVEVQAQDLPPLGVTLVTECPSAFKGGSGGT